MSSNILCFAIAVAALGTGCARNAPPPVSYTYNTHINNHLATPAPPVSEFPCGHSLTVKVGKLDVDMPKGGSLEIAGVKGSTNAYHVLLQDVEFSTTDHCIK